MVNQIVLSPSSDGRPDLHVANASGGSAARRLGGSELHLGSQDLIRFASYATRKKFQVASLMLADAHLVPLSAAEQARISTDMLNLLSNYGVRELEAAMQDEFSGIYVVGVNLIAKASGRRIQVRRRGYVETSIVQEAESLLKSAWRELRLS